MNIKIRLTLFLLSIFFISISVIQADIPSAQMSSKVRVGSDISQEERKFVLKKEKKTRSALKELIGDLNEKDSNLPRIAYMGSGGGCRAATGTLGALLGAELIKLLPTFTYAFGLSGSTWGLFPWLESNKTIEQYLQSFETKLQKGIIKPLNASQDTLSYFIKTLIAKKKQGFSINYIDWYGAMLANVLLSGNTIQQRLDITMSSLKKQLNTYNYPLPIGTAVDTSEAPKRIWFEFSPFEVGSSELQAFVPTQDFGRVFENGVTKNSTSEQSLGYLLGIFGSAFSFRAAELASMITNLDKLTLEKILPSAQLSSAMLPNITYKMKKMDKNNIKKLALSDAGHDAAGSILDSASIHGTNLPMIPALRKERGIDIIIIVDSSGTLEGAPALRAADAQAHSLGLPFPYISEDDYLRISGKEVSVFWDKKSLKTPMIIYMQAKTIKSASGSFEKGMLEPGKNRYPSEKFTYSADDVKDLSEVLIDKFINNKEIIVGAIQNWIEVKKKLGDRKGLSPISDSIAITMPTTSSSQTSSSSKTNKTAY